MHSSPISATGTQTQKTEFPAEKVRSKKFHRNKSSNREKDIDEKAGETLPSNSQEISNKSPSRRLSHTISNDRSPPKATYTLEIFQKSQSATESNDKLIERNEIPNTEWLDKLIERNEIPNSQAREICFTDCKVTCNVAKKLFPIITSNSNFTTLSFSKGQLDESIFSELEKSFSSNKTKIRNVEFNEIHLSYRSFADLINLLKKYPNTVLTLNKCSLIESKTEESATFSEILKRNTASSNICNTNTVLSEHDNSLSIKLLDLKIDQDKFDDVVTGILNTNSAELHIHMGQYVAENNVQFIGHGNIIKNLLKTSTPSLLNEDAKKIIKFYNVSISASALSGLVQKLQGYKKYRLRLEKCTILLKDEDGLKSFAEQLASTKKTCKGYPLILELINVKTDLDKDLGRFIESILSSNISHLHLQKCNVMSITEHIKKALSSQKCSLDSLLISEDQFDLLSLENLTDGIIEQNKHVRGLSRITIEDCDLNTVHAQLIGKLISNGKKLTTIGLHKNSLGSEFIIPFPSRRRSSSNVLLSNIKKTNAENIKTKDFESTTVSNESSSEVKKVPSQQLQGSGEKKLKAMEIIGAAIEERWTSENCQPLILSLTSNHLNANDANILSKALQKHSYIKENQPPVYVDAGGNSLQSKIDDSNQVLLNTKGESPRSILIPQTKAEIISRTNSEENRYKLPELNSNLIKATPRVNVTLSPRRESSPILSPRSQPKITATQITKTSDQT